MTRIRPLVAVFLVATAALVLVSPAGNRGALADHIARFSALWPEQTLRPALVTQLAVDSGDPALAWRTRPRDVALRFATTVLGWQAPVVRDEYRWPYRFETVEVWIAETGDHVGVNEPAAHGVLLQRMLRAGPSGIWSVMSVDSSRIVEPRNWTPRLPFSFGHIVETRTSGLPEGTSALAAWKLRAGCGVLARARRIYYWHEWTQFQVNPNGYTPMCHFAQDETEELGETFRGHIMIVRGEGLQPEDVRVLFRPQEPREHPILDLTATTAMFGLHKTARELADPPWGWRDEPFEPRAWAIDPARAPLCPDHRVVLASPTAGFDAGTDLGVGVDIEVHARGACRIREVFELSISGPRGPLEQPGPASATTFVRGVLPRDYVTAGWAVSNVCARRPAFTVRGAGQQITFPALFRFRGCGDPSSPPAIYNSDQF